MALSPPVPLRVPGLSRSLSLHVHGEQDTHVSRRLREEGIWEAYETSLVLSLLREGDTFLDIGANIGYFSVLGASVVGDAGKVFAFEPDPDNFRLLQANIALNGMDGWVTPVEAALSEQPGDGRLYLSEDNLGDHRVYVGEDIRDSRAIRLLNGSEYLGAQLSRVDLVKVDTQGAEYAVLKGLMPLLLSLPQKPRLVVELTPHALREAGASGRALLELLDALGQPMWMIDHVAGTLLPSTAEELAVWSDNWDAVPESRGFINFLVGEAP